MAKPQKKVAPTKTSSATILEPYKPTPAEKVALSRYITRSDKRPSARIQVSKGKTGVTTQPDHSDPMTGSVNLMNALGTVSLPFTTQVEALKRYRSDGQQTVRVERVTVEAGGQAVVGSVSASSARGRGPQ
jgi:hypothetical protein